MLMIISARKRKIIKEKEKKNSEGMLTKSNLAPSTIPIQTLGFCQAASRHHGNSPCRPTSQHYGTKGFRAALNASPIVPRGISLADNADESYSQDDWILAHWILAHWILAHWILAYWILAHWILAHWILAIFSRPIQRWD